MVREGETANYLLMTVSLYLSMFNIFISLLHLLGFAGGDD
jgi:modulator of FtsH protease